MRFITLTTCTPGDPLAYFHRQALASVVVDHGQGSDATSLNSRVGNKSIDLHWLAVLASSCACVIR